MIDQLAEREDAVIASARRPTRKQVKKLRMVFSNKGSWISSPGTEFAPSYLVNVLADRSDASIGKGHVG